MVRSHLYRGECTAAILGSQLSTTSSDDTELHQWATPSYVYHNQLRTMASETVDPIYRLLLPSLYREVPHQQLREYKSVQPLSGIESNCLAYAASQGIRLCLSALPMLLCLCSHLQARGCEPRRRIRITMSNYSTTCNRKGADDTGRAQHKVHE